MRRWPRGLFHSESRPPRARGHVPGRERGVPEDVHFGRELGERDALVVDHRVGGGAARRTRRLLGDRPRAPTSSLQPGRAATRSICTASSQSTSQTASTRLRQRPRLDQQRNVEDQRRRGRGAARPRARPRGRSADAGLPPAGVAQRGVVERRAGACAGRSRPPSAAMKPAPNAAAIAPSAAPPGSVRRRAIRSVSITTAPRLASIAPTVLLPLPMPPVRPMRKAVMRASTRTSVRPGPAQPAEDALGPGEHDHQPGAGEEGAEGHVAAFAQRRRHLHDDADDRADHRGAEHDRQDHLPAQPGTERGEQLEVAEAHAFLAGGELEQPVDRPEREVARRRRPRPRRRAAIVQPSAALDEAGPEQRQRQVVGQQRSCPSRCRRARPGPRRSRTTASATGSAPKRQPTSANRTPVASSTSG